MKPTSIDSFTKMKNSRQCEAILSVMDKNTWLAVHEIGALIRQKGIFYNDPGISATLRKPYEKGGLREMVEGRKRIASSLIKEWRLYSGPPRQENKSLFAHQTRRQLLDTIILLEAEVDRLKKIEHGEIY